MKIQHKNVMSGLLALLLLSVSSVTAIGNDQSSSVADTVQEDVERAPHAWLYLHELQQEYLTGEQRTQLSHLAYHGTVSVLCEGIVLDRAQFDKSITALDHKDMSGLSDEEYKLHHQKVLVSYGATLGVMLAEHAADSADFCSEAEVYIDENPEDHLFDKEIYIQTN